MENKMELTYVAKDDGMSEISVKVNANGLELKCKASEWLSLLNLL